MAVNPLVQLLEDAKTHTYRCEVALAAASYFAERVGIHSEAVAEIMILAAVSQAKALQEAPMLAQEEWSEKRNKTPFFKRRKVAHVVPHEYIEEWKFNQQIKALNDLDNAFELLKGLDKNGGGAG